jgi:hypothetical protein
MRIYWGLVFWTRSEYHYYAIGTFVVAKSSRFPKHICNWWGFLQGADSGTLVSLFRIRKHPQDVVVFAAKFFF